MTENAPHSSVLGAHSLERSLQTGLLVSFLVLMFVFWWGGSLASRFLAESVVHARLAEEGHALIAGRNNVFLESASLNNLRWSVAYSTPSSGHYFRMDTPGQRPIQSRSSWEMELPSESLAPGAQQRLSGFGPSGEPLLLWRGGYQFDGASVTVTVAEDVTEIQNRLQAFRIFFAVVSLILLAALLLVQTAIVRHLLAPVDELMGDLQRI